jgi:hypothetical protein
MSRYWLRCKECEVYVDNNNNILIGDVKLICEAKSLELD